MQVLRVQLLLTRALYLFAEAHVWVKETGKQVYLGGYALEVRIAQPHNLPTSYARAAPTGAHARTRQEHAAEAFDVCAYKVSVVCTM